MMNKFIKAIKALSLLIRNPKKLNLILNENLVWENRVIKKFRIESLPVISFDDIVCEPVIVEPFAFLDGGSLVTDIALLKQLAKSIPECRYFEIGTWRGESVANVATCAKTCYTLNLSDAEILNLLNSNDYVNSHRFFSKRDSSIVHLDGNSRTFDFKSLETKFDLIFIDGDHHFESIVNDTKKALKYLSHENTVIVWHDYTYSPETIRYETLAAIFEACPLPLHQHIYHVKNTNCALLFRKHTASIPFRKYEPPVYSFSISIKTTRL